MISGLIEEGMEKGIQQEKFDVAKNCRRKSFDVKDIQAIEDLSEAELLKIAKEL